MRQYLMGELSEQERNDLEEKYFNDNELFGELLDAEDQIIDDYHRGKLSLSERERVEQHFLALPERRREVKLAILFAQYLAERRASGPPAPNPAPGARSLINLPLFGPLFAWLRAPRSIPGWTLVAAALTLTLGGVWVVMNTSRSQIQPAPGPAKQGEQANRARIEAELAILQTRPVPAKGAISFTLARGASRGQEEIKKITPGPETTVIEFTLDAGAENYASYQASLQKAYNESDGILIKQLEVKTTAAGKSVMVRLPATMLDTDDYQIKLEGISPQGAAYIIGKYLFQVRR
jgi:hypothetical protein